MGGATDGRRKQRIQVALSCSECGARNYKTSKARRDGAEPLRLKKFCKVCNKHTLHLETK